MNLEWSDAARVDLLRVYEFLATHSPTAAERAVDALLAAPRRLLANPGLGSRIEEFEPAEVRRLLIGGYDLRYSLDQDTILILRIWHAREDR